MKTVLRKRNKRQAHKLYLELLEPRQLMSAVLWTGGSSGSWGTAANWTTIDTSAHAVPTSSDDVLFAPGETVAVALDDSFTVGSMVIGTNTSVTVQQGEDLDPSVRPTLTVNNNVAMITENATDNTMFSVGDNTVVQAAVIAGVGNFNYVGGGISVNNGSLYVTGILAAGGTAEATALEAMSHLTSGTLELSAAVNAALSAATGLSSFDGSTLIDYVTDHAGAFAPPTLSASGNGLISATAVDGILKLSITGPTAGITAIELNVGNAVEDEFGNVTLNGTGGLEELSIGTLIAPGGTIVAGTDNSAVPTLRIDQGPDHAHFLTSWAIGIDSGENLFNAAATNAALGYTDPFLRAYLSIADAASHGIGGTLTTGWHSGGHPHKVYADFVYGFDGDGHFATSSLGFEMPVALTGAFVDFARFFNITPVVDVTDSSNEAVSVVLLHADAGFIGEFTDMAGFDGATIGLDTSIYTWHLDIQVMESGSNLVLASGT